MILLALSGSPAVANAPPEAACGVTHRVDPLSDARVGVAICRGVSSHAQSTPRLRFHCDAGQLEVWIDWDTFVGNRDQRVLLRVGEGPARSWVWGISTGHTATLLPGSPSEVRTLAVSMAGQRVVGRTTPYGQDPVTATWHVSQEVADMVRSCDATGLNAPVGVHIEPKSFVGAGVERARGAVASRESEALVCVRSEEDRRSLPGAVSVQLIFGDGEVSRTAVTRNSFPSWEVGECLKELFDQQSVDPSISGTGEWLFRFHDPRATGVDGTCAMFLELQASGVSLGTLGRVARELEGMTEQTVLCLEGNGVEESLVGTVRAHVRSQ